MIRKSPTFEGSGGADERSVELEFEDELETFDESGIFTRELTHPFYRSNPFILSGYRQNFTCCQAMQSACFPHNELGNIWSHLLPAAFYAYMSWHHGTLAWSLRTEAAQVHIEGGPSVESEAAHTASLGVLASAHTNMLLYTLCATTVFFLSAIFHTFSCISVYMCALLCRLDYAGILVQITGSSISGFYFVFYCEPDRLALHVFLCFCVNLLGFVVTLHSEFQSPKYNAFRATVFSCAALYALFPMTQVALSDGLDVYLAHYTGYVWQLAAYGTGVILYVLHIPERFAPGRFDYLIHSHTLMHIFVFIASYIHYATLHDNMEYRLLVGGCPAAAS